MRLSFRDAVRRSGTTVCVVTTVANPFPRVSPPNQQSNVTSNQHYIVIALEK
jgi:flavin reductase (DIM6/NTAB) family NADH-FMN oxidoreductase RutF